MTRRPLCLLCLLVVCVMCIADGLGMPLITGNPLPASLQKHVAGQPESVICGEVERCAGTEFSQSVFLKETYLIYNSQKISIKNVRVFLKENEKVPAGTVLLLSGKLEEVPSPGNPGEFDSRQYYACRHIYYFMKKAVILKKSTAYSGYGQFLLDMQERFANVLEQAAGEEAGVFSAVVLGDKTGLEPETKLRYQMAGIIHIMAISGLHISLLGMGLYQLLKRLGLGIWPAGILALAVMLQYGMMTGGSVSSMRAVCMFLISVGAKLAGRIYDTLTALAVAALVILWESPAWLYSSGFLLSFGAVLGIGVVLPRIVKMMGVKGKVKKALLCSLSVQVTMLPVSLVFFGEVSLTGIFLNLIVLPTVGMVLGSGVAAALLGLLWLPAGMAAAAPGRVLLKGYQWLCDVAAGMPFCTWVGGCPGRWQIVVYYVILAGVLWLGERWMGEVRRPETAPETGKGGLRRRLSGVCLLIAAVVFGICLLAYRPGGKLKITCLDVGQGDAIVMETPDKGHYLIDCGSSSKSGTGQYQLLPYLKSQGISYVDGILISHTDEDHISGVRQLLEFVRDRLTVIRVGTLLLPRWEEEPKEWQELARLAEEAGVQVVSVCEGMRFKAGDVEFSVLAPFEDAAGSDVNEEGMVVQLEWKGFRGLFTGDVGEGTEKKLLSRMKDVDFLKVGHHGSKYSSGEAFLEKIRPELGVISCSATNTYGHPSTEAVERLEKAGCKLEYTMKSGAVTVSTDGEQMWAERFREDKK